MPVRYGDRGRSEETGGAHPTKQIVTVEVLVVERANRTPTENDDFVLPKSHCFRQFRSHTLAFWLI